MLDRLQGEAAREQERVARDRAAVAQRQLMEAMPIAISVTSEVDQRVLFANAASPHACELPGGMTSDPRNILTLLYTEDRAAFHQYYLNGKGRRPRPGVTAYGEPFGC
jgi:hypothetical protein